MFPIVVLAGLTGYRKFHQSSGVEVILPISGYDPRDLLSGHYLIYQVNYGVPALCLNTPHASEAFVCLDDKSFHTARPMACQQLIKGKCHDSRFVAGIEKFYVPEQQAKVLEAKVMGNSASIKLSLLPNGSAQVKDLLIEGKSWKE